MITVAKSSLPGIMKVVAISVFAAVAVNVALRFVLVTTRPLTYKEEWLAIAVATIVLSVPSAMLYRRLYSWRMWVFCIVFAFSSTVVQNILDNLCEVVWETSHVTLTPYPGLHVLPLFIDKLDFAIISVIGTLCAWTVSRVLRGRIVIDDGVLCPKCNYCLIGSENFTCPECGREFTFEELGVSGEYVALYRKTQGGMGSPISARPNPGRLGE